MKTPSFFENSEFQVIAGPCAVESEEQMEQIAQVLKEENVPFLRGGVFKMRTQPQSFQGLGESAIKLIKNLKLKYPLSFVSEITDPRQLNKLSEVVDIFQVGTRNMYNYELLKELGQQPKPVLLKRGFSARIDEWLNAVEYIFQGGNQKVILCERGIRTFETATRNTLDLAGALLAKKKSSLPVIVDPSHGTGDCSLVARMAMAVVATGLDGLLIEVHPQPEKALSDGYQSLNFNQFKHTMKEIKKILKCLNPQKK